MGTKKGGLGAQKIKVDFSQAEQKANELDKERESMGKLSLIDNTSSGKADGGNSNTGSTALSSKFMIQEQKASILSVFFF